MSTATTTIRYVLEASTGPQRFQTDLCPPGPLTVGRRASHNVPLLGSDDISRDHATLIFRESPEGGTWYILDTKSKHGTRVNGVPLVPERAYPLQHEDLIDIHPYSLRFRDRQATPSAQHTLNTIDDQDSSRSVVSTFDKSQRRSLSPERMELLLDCARMIHTAEDESALAETVVDAARQGTGYANVALLRPGAQDNTLDLVTHVGTLIGPSDEPLLSRSLIREAERGTPVRLADPLAVPGGSHSIAELGIVQALCVPLLLGNSVSGYLYLDNRNADAAHQRVFADASEFADVLGQLASLAMANLMRLDLEKRQAAMLAELHAASELQQLIMPANAVQAGGLTAIGKCRPGRLVSGDFFDIFALKDQRLAVVLGDVMGKGVAASVLMAGAQGFLHHALHRDGDPEHAVRALNAYLAPRCHGQRFVTLWVGVFDAANAALDYVDAGHGLALLVHSSGDLQELRAAGGPPVGVDETANYKSDRVAVRPRDAVVVVSDGVVEQPDKQPERGATFEAFGTNRLMEYLHQFSAGEDLLTAIFEAVEDFAGTTSLADDATVVTVQWQ